MNANTKTWLKKGLVGLAVLVVGGLVYGYTSFAPLANTGTGLVAHQMCSCVHVSNRELEVCLGDRWPDMQTIQAEPIAVDGAPGIEATSVFGTRTAIYEPGFGCTLQD